MPPRRRHAAPWAPLALSLALVCAPTPAQVRLPALGEAASEDMDVSVERRLGEQIMRDVYRDPAYLDDPVLLEYVQSIWQPLVAAARRQGQIGADLDAAFAWNVFLVRDRSVNAFALPAGWVGVHLGLIAMTETADELASVLAHELSHVAQRHIARGIGKAQRNSLVGAAAMILGVLAASRAGNADAAQAAVVGGQAAIMQSQLNFSREVEREADRIGFGVLTDAGFAGSGMASMFEKLAHANRLNDSGSYPYLRSHPLTTERISEARLRAPTAAPGAHAGDMLHALMRERASVLMDPSVENLRRIAERPVPSNEGDATLVANYASSLAKVMLGERVSPRLPPPALQPPRGAGAAFVQRMQALLDAEIALSRGDFTLALAVLSAVPSDGRRPGRAELLLQAQAAALWADAPGGDGGAAARRSVEALQTWTSEHPDDAAAWARLAQCAAAVDLKLRAARAGAEARAASGDLGGAIDALRAAQRRARSDPQADPIEAQIIDARLASLLLRRRAELQDGVDPGRRPLGRAGPSDARRPPA